jgi:organic radical activating enzyme
MAFIVPNLEASITNVCNLHCDGCQNYANYGLKGFVEFDVFAKDIMDWSSRIYPREFRILGGEPFLHPSLEQFIQLSAQAFPSSRRIVTTNGLRAITRKDIIKSFIQTKTELELSFRAYPLNADTHHI